MAIRWDFNDDHMGKVIIEQQFEDKPERFTIDIYKGNCFAIFVHNFEQDGKKMYNLYNFFMDKEHAKRMLGLDRKYSATYGHNQMDDGSDRMIAFHLDNTKESRDLAKLLMDAKWKHPLKIVIHPSIESAKEAEA